MRRLCNRLGIRPSSVNKQSKHLDMDHPAMEAVRSFVSMCQATHGVEPRLIGNFDQVWTVHYEPPRKVMYKHQQQRGQILNADASQMPSVKSMVNKIRVALSLDPETASESKVEVCKPRALNAAGQLSPVDYARVARTTTTLSWCDGDLGRAYVTLQPGAMQLASLRKDIGYIQSGL